MEEKTWKKIALVMLLLSFIMVGYYIGWAREQIKGCECKCDCDNLMIFLY